MSQRFNDTLTTDTRGDYGKGLSVFQNNKKEERDGEHGRKSNVNLKQQGRDLKTNVAKGLSKRHISTRGKVVKQWIMSSQRTQT